MDFGWNGKRVRNYGDVVDVIADITTKEEAHDFLAIYASNAGGVDAALHNIGFLSAELDDDKRQRVCQLFETTHPIFGNPETIGEEEIKDASARAVWGSQCN